MVSKLTRRAAIGAALALPIAGGATALLRSSGPRVAADGTIELTWEDLLPEGGTSGGLSGVVQHSQIATLFEQPASTGIRSDWNEQRVRIPGYVVPIQFDGDLVTDFILVPFVGACIHVPPPPANQLVYVRADTPFETTGMFDAVSVTGQFNTMQIATQLATIGYQMQADAVQLM